MICLPKKRTVKNDKRCYPNLFATLLHFLYLCIRNLNYSFLKRSLYIQILSAFLLFVFAFSITPKVFLHDVFAGHIDVQQQKNTKGAYHLNKAGFNCDKQGFVATSPFLADEQAICFCDFVPFSIFIDGAIDLYSSDKLFSLLRGPPANMIC